MAIGSGNDSWPDAQDIGGGAADGALTYDGQTRWYKFPVAPNQQVTIDLTSLPADYDLLLFTDVADAYKNLVSSNLTKVTAESSGKGGNLSFSGKGGNLAFSGKGGNLSFSGKGGNLAFSGKGGNLSFSGDVFSGKGGNLVFSGKGGNLSFSGTGTQPKYSPEAYSSAQISSLIAFSAADGTAPEQLVGNTFNDSGDFYLRVSGANGGFDPSKLFHLTVAVSPTACDNASNDYHLDDLPAVDTSRQFSTIILTNPTAAFLDGYSASTFSSKLTSLAARTEVSGKVVDVSTSPRIQKLITQADTHPSCANAKNLLADGLKAIIDSYRPTSPTLKYVVLVGGDSTIPFFRYPDTAELGAESTFFPPVQTTSPSEASLRLNSVLSQDAYGAATEIKHGVATFPVPSLAVGRLVENATDAATVIDAYLTGTTSGTGLVPTPTRSLTTGYDFMTDSAKYVDTSFAAGLRPGSTHDALINNTWTAGQLNTSLLGSRHDLIFLAGHFSADKALAADFTTVLSTADLKASATSFTNAIVFSQGCHSGYNTVDGDAIDGVTAKLDWAQAFAQKGATLIGGTGFQYGDTDLIAYSEQIYANFADELRTGTGAVSVGQALIKAKQDYLRQTPDIQGTDTKALLESTLFGLPMLSVNMPGTRLPAPTTTSQVALPPVVPSGPGAALSLRTTPFTVTPGSLTSKPGSGGTTYLDTSSSPTVPGPVSVKPNEPVLPLISKDVSVTGQTLRGVGFLGGAYHDQNPVTPLVSSAGTELGGAPTSFSSAYLYPTRIATANYYDALGNGATRLQITPVQHQSSGSAFTRRVFDSVNLQLYYSSTGPNVTVGDYRPALAAAPSILDTTATDLGAGGVRFDAHVAVDPAAGIQDVWVAYTFGTRWDPLHLVANDPADPTHWSAVLSHSAAGLKYIIEAVNGVGMVSLDANGGAFYSFSQPITHPTTVAIHVDGGVTQGTFGSTIGVSADLSGAVPLIGPDHPIQPWWHVGVRHDRCRRPCHGDARPQLPPW